MKYKSNHNSKNLLLKLLQVCNNFFKFLYSPDQYKKSARKFEDSDYKQRMKMSHYRWKIKIEKSSLISEINLKRRFIIFYVYHFSHLPETFDRQNEQFFSYC